jgi:hypothetical protein
MITVFESAKTVHALDRAVTVIGSLKLDATLVEMIAMSINKP